MHDAHFHMTQPLFEALKENQMMGIANAENIEEYEYVTSLQKEYVFLNSCGIHPWHVDTVSFDSFYPYLEKAKIIGEIGLDNTWCTTDLNLQKEVFDSQLQYACLKHKPVILHLKGMEKEALDYLRKYPNTYIVHWYSRYEYLEEYIQLGCYFTVGPSVGKDDTVSNVVRNVSLDHLLMESDGINAIAWAFDCDEKDIDYISCLKNSIQNIASIKKETYEVTEKQLDENFIKLFMNK